MQDHAGLSRTRPSNRMRHGLRSRARSEARIYEAVDLTSLLARPAPSSPLVQAAAADVADAILHLADVQHAILSLLSPAPQEDHGRNEAPDVDEGLLASLGRMRREVPDLMRLRDYERKVLSRRNRAINRLDYLILEARRSRQRMIDAGRVVSGKLDLSDFG